MKKIVAVIVFSVFVALLPVKTVHAAESDSLKRVLTDGLYGGAAGALLGTASWALAEEPKDKTSNIGKGAAIGVILGVIYGTAKVSGAFAEVKDGKMMVQIPTIQLFSNMSVGVNMVKVSF